MAHSLLHTRQTPLPVAAFLEEVCDLPPKEIRKENTETRAWIATANGETYFLKWVTTEKYERMLAKDAIISALELHPAITRLFNLVETADGMLLVYENVDGEVLDREVRKRFFALPVATKLAALQTIFAALAAIVEAGWIIGDFYEGNVIYDFDTEAIRIFDFECFERGSGYVLQLDCSYGSSRLRPPEEYVRGAWIDQRANVYTLGRYAINALSSRIDEAWQTEFQGNQSLARVLEQATRRNPHQRYQTVRAFVDAFGSSIEENA